MRNIGVVWGAILGSITLVMGGCMSAGPSERSQWESYRVAAADKDQSAGEGLLLVPEAKPSFSSTLTPVAKTDHQVMVEARFVYFCGRPCRSIGGIAIKTPGEGTVLSDAQVKAFLDAVRKEHPSNVMQTPRMILTDGSTGEITVASRWPVTLPKADTPGQTVALRVPYETTLWAKVQKQGTQGWMSLDLEPTWSIVCGDKGSYDELKAHQRFSTCIPSQSTMLYRLATDRLRLMSVRETTDPTSKVKRVDILKSPVEIDGMEDHLFLLVSAKEMK